MLTYEENIVSIGYSLTKPRSRHYKAEVNK